MDSVIAGPVVATGSVLVALVAIWIAYYALYGWRKKR